MATGVTAQASGETHDSKYRTMYNGLGDKFTAKTVTGKMREKVE